jgi:predicted transcriptional regulator YdeE
MKMEFSINFLASDRFIVGVQGHEDAIRDSWELLHQLVDTIPNTLAEFPEGESFGICTRLSDAVTGERITYTAGVPVDDLSQVPRHLIGHVIPAGRYAVFKTDSLESIGDTYEQIHQWIPASGHRRRLNFDFERYNLENGVETIEIWVPV